MRRLFILLIVALGLSACSSRVIHEQPVFVSAPDAINVNHATADQLEKLPGIGRNTAEAIVEYRGVNGPFRRVEHLMLIRGVSETRFAELRPYVKTE